MPGAVEAGAGAVVVEVVAVGAAGCEAAAEEVVGSAAARLPADFPEAGGLLPGREAGVVALRAEEEPVSTAGLRSALPVGGARAAALWREAVRRSNRGRDPRLPVAPEARDRELASASGRRLAREGRDLALAPGSCRSVVREGRDLELAWASDRELDPASRLDSGRPICRAWDLAEVCRGDAFRTCRRRAGTAPPASRIEWPTAATA